MPTPQFNPNAPYRSAPPATAFDPNAAFSMADTSGTGQGESPNYGPGVNVVNPTASQIGKGALREGAQLAAGAHGIGRGILDLIPGVKNSGFGKAMLAHQQTLDGAAQPQNAGEAMGKLLPEMAPYLAPAKLETSAAELVPEAMRPLARIGMSALSNGTMSKMNGGNFGTGATMGAGAGALGEGARAFLAPSFVRSAIPGGISKDTANAVLEETRGMRPKTILNSTEGRIGRASSDLDASISAAEPNDIISMRPAREPVQQALTSAHGMEAGGLHNQISDVMDFLRKGRVSGEPIPDTVTPQRALNLRRGLNEEYLGNRDWKKTVNDRATAATKQAYGGLTSELHAKVPGSVEADEMMSGLIPARNGLRSLVRTDPSIAGNVMGRMGARTGALTSAAMGAAGGASSAGLPGAILGGATGLIAPEMLSAPAAKMGLARALYTTATPKIARAILTPAAQHAMDYIRQKHIGGQE